MSNSTLALVWDAWRARRGGPDLEAPIHAPQLAA